MGLRLRSGEKASAWHKGPGGVLDRGTGSCWSSQKPQSSQDETGAARPGVPAGGRGPFYSDASRPSHQPPPPAGPGAAEVRGGQPGPPRVLPFPLLPIGLIALFTVTHPRPLPKGPVGILGSTHWVNVYLIFFFSINF